VTLTSKLLSRTTLLATTLGSALLLGACASMPATSLAPPHPPLVEGRTVDVVPYPDQRKLLASRDPALAANKRLVFDMWRTLFNAGQLEKADQFLSPNYQEHSIVVPNGVAGFARYHSARITRQNAVPALITDPIVTMVAEGDYVAVARVAHYLEPDDSGASYTTTYFDVFRLDNGRIAEHWDSAQIVPGEIPLSAAQGGAVPVTGTEGFPQLAMLQNTNPVLANNKRLAFDLWRHTSEAGREEMAYNYLDPIYIQHNPNAVTGRDGFIEYMAMRPDTLIDPYLEAPLITAIAEGDLVVQVLVGERRDPNHEGVIVKIAWIDMFRMQDGRVIEHWDTAAKGEYPKTPN